MDRRYVIADVFAGAAYGGNPLAVVLDGADLDARQMQAVAREMNLSETTFVTPGSAPGHFAVRIFTPLRELPFAGHPTIGTAVVLAETGAAPGRTEIVLEEGIGPVRVSLRPGSATFSLTGRAERRDAGVSIGAIAAALGLRENAIVGAPWQAGYGGVGYLYVELADKAAVANAWLRGEDFASFGLWGHGVYTFAATARAPGHETLYGRCFVPGAGVPEDPATGSAAAGLAGSRVGGMRDGRFKLTIAQGVDMGRPSRIETEALVAHGQVTGVSVSGDVVTVAEGRLLRLP